MTSATTYDRDLLPLPHYQHCHGSKAFSIYRNVKYATKELHVAKIGLYRLTSEVENC